MIGEVGSCFLEPKQPKGGACEMENAPNGPIYRILKHALPVSHQEDRPKEVIFPGGQGCSLEEANRIISYLQNEQAKQGGVNQDKTDHVVKQKAVSSADDKVKSAKTGKKRVFRGGRLLYIV